MTKKSDAPTTSQPLRVGPADAEVIRFASVPDGNIYRMRKSVAKDDARRARNKRKKAKKK